MHTGLTIFPTDYSISMPDLAREAEARGFESLWVSEHSHIPVSRKSPYPAGGELPKMYYDTLDPFVALAAAASVTERIKLGTGVCLVIQRDPIHTAKEVASLDRVSNGRFLFGVGGGWNVEEMADHGTRAEQRFRLLRERIEAMKTLWTEKEAEYHGELVHIERSYMWPKPVQKPYPPIHVGGAWPSAAKRAVAYGDGWLPIAIPGDRMAERIEEFQAMATKAGRDPAKMEVSVFGVVGKEKVLAAYRDAGVTRVVLGLPPADRETILPLLDRFAATVRDVG
jgi:probable F420-dependent oxidoreductase